MTQEEQKKLFSRFGLSYWDQHDPEDYLLAIMEKLVEIEDTVAALAAGVRPPYWPAGPK